MGSWKWPGFISLKPGSRGARFLFLFVCCVLRFSGWIRGLLRLPCLVAGGLSKSSSHCFLSRSPSSTFSGFSGSVNSGSSDPSFLLFTRKSHLPPPAQAPHCRAHSPSCFLRTQASGNQGPLPSIAPLLFPKPQKGPPSAWLFLSQELSQGESSEVPAPKHGTVSLWKTSPHGERIQGFFFGSWLGASNLSGSLTNLYGFCC